MDAGNTGLTIEELYDQYGRLAFFIIFRLVLNRETAEDLTQETFLRIWNSAKGYDEKRGPLKNWVATIARNCAIDYLRSADGRVFREAVPLDRTRQVSATGVHPEVSTLLRQVASVLSADDRMVLDLCYGEGLSHTEIAKALQRPLGTVKTWIRRALQNMRAEMKVTVES
jgi:RNA polymerase sigma-70 factor (ECF subfamily)